MLCDVCKYSLEGMKDPTLTPRLETLPPLPEDAGRLRFEIEKYVFGHHRTKDS